MRGFLARMAARQTNHGIQRACASTSQRSLLRYRGCVQSTGRCHGSPRAWLPEGAEFIGKMKMLLPEAKFEVVDHASFSVERRKRAYFASAEFGLTALTRLTGTCTVAEFFDIDQGRGPYLMRSGSSGSKLVPSRELIEAQKANYYQLRPAARMGQVGG